MSGSDKPRSMLAGRHGHRRSGKQLLSNNSVNEKLNSRRMQFFSSGARMTDEELAERDEQRKASIESVRKAIEAASIVDPIRPLRRFQCKLLVALHYHSTTKAGKAKLTRCQAVMVDSTPFSKFAQWAALQLEIKEEKAKTLTFQYFNDSGSTSNRRCSSGSMHRGRATRFTCTCTRSSRSWCRQRIVPS